MQENLDDLLTYEQAAGVIGISLPSVKQMVNRGVLHPIKIPRERHKFLKRAEVVRYRDGREAYKASQADTPPTMANNSSGVSGLSPANTFPQEMPETLQLLIMVAGIAWTSHTASIRDALIGVAQAYYSSPPGLAGSSPYLARQAAQQNPETPLGAVPQENSSAPSTSLVRQIYETLAKSIGQTAADEQAIHQLQDLLTRYVQSRERFSPPSAPEPVKRP